ADSGGPLSWPLPAAVIGLAAMAWLSWRAVRTDRLRASTLVWGGWLLITGAVFSFMAGIIHPYYTVALVPAIGALTGIGAVELWRRRQHAAARLALAAGIAATAAWAYLLLGRTPAWLPWLRTAVLLCGLLAAAAVLVRRSDPPEPPGTPPASPSPFTAPGRQAGRPHRVLAM